MAGTEPTVIKKYANRRLYHTGTSTYVTLDDLARMVKDGEDFVVQDAKSGNDITRVVLGQIIFEQENKGPHLLPISFLRQLIRFYGDSMQSIVPSYLETSLAAFTRDQDKLREQFTKAIQGAPGLEIAEDVARRNMDMFQEALRMWMPFQTGNDKPTAGDTGKSGKGGDNQSELDSLRQQLKDMQKTIDSIAGKD